MVTVRHVEAVDFGEVDWVYITVELGGFSHLLVPDVADPLKEEQREDVRLPIRAIDGAAAQYLGAVPEMRLELLQGQGHFNPDALSNTVHQP